MKNRTLTLPAAQPRFLVHDKSGRPHIVEGNNKYTLFQCQVIRPYCYILLKPRKKVRFIVSTATVNKGKRGKMHRMKWISRYDAKYLPKSRLFLDFHERYLLVWDMKGMDVSPSKKGSAFNLNNNNQPMQTIKLTFLATLLLFLFLAGSSQSEMQPLLKNRAGVPPFDILKEILATQNRQPCGNDRLPQDNAAPYITWLADSDARVQPHSIIACPERKIFSVRNLANQLTSSLAALDYGVRHLHSPMLLITGNTDSEALRLFANGYAYLEPTIRQELDHLYPALRSAGTETTDEGGNEETRQVEKNVDYQVRQAMNRYADRIKNGRLTVVGSVLDITNRYGRGANQLIIININGEIDGRKLRKMELLRRMDPALLTPIGRQTAGAYD